VLPATRQRLIQAQQREREERKQRAREEQAREERQRQQREQKERARRALEDHAGTTAREDLKSLVKKESNDSSTVSVETTNFARYCRLLMDVGREVLMTLFKENYREEEGVQWEESCSPSFFGDKFPDRFSESNLGKHFIDSICSGKCHEWDDAPVVLVYIHSRLCSG